MNEATQDGITGGQGADSTLEDRILDMVKRLGGVSFAELERIDGFRGEHALVIEPWNVLLWDGLSTEAIDAITQLREQKQIVPNPCSVLVYMVDGKVPSLPVAKRRVRYKKLHWLPTTFSLEKGA